jgi:hypothetical protein
MTRKIAIAALLGLLFWGSTEVLAEFPPETFPEDPKDSPASEEEYLTPKKRRRQDPAPNKRVIRPRDPVARQSIEEEEDTAPEPPSRRTFRLEFGIGFSSFSSSDSARQANLSLAGLGEQFALQGGMDARLGTGFGLELEGFSASTPANELDLGGGNIITQQIKQIGLMGSIRYELAFPSRKFHWKPRVFAGYGIHSFGQEAGLALGPGGYSFSLNGLHVGLGLEMQYGESFTVLADFALSLGASGSLTTLGSSGSGVEALSGPSYSRLRVAARIQLFDGFSVGPTLFLRNVRSNAPSRGGLYIGASEAALQFLGVAALEF